MLEKKGIKLAALTLGDDGALLINKQAQVRIKGLKIRNKDTTGAGDVFNGALAKALSDGIGIKEAIKFANAAASLSVTKLGAQTSAPKESEIRALLA